MAGAQFEYDEKGTTFYYFLLSFFGIVLVPVTYYVWKITKLPGELKNRDSCTQNNHELGSASNSAVFNANNSIHKFISSVCFDFFS